MSYILEALRKAERERTLGQPPRIGDVAQAQAPVGAPRSMMPWIATVTLLVLVLTLLLFLLLRGQPVATTAAVTTSPSAQPQAAAVQGLNPVPTPSPAVSAPAAGSPPPTAPQAEVNALADDAEVATLDDLVDRPQPVIQAVPTLISPTLSQPDPPTAPVSAEAEPPIAALNNGTVASTRLAPAPQVRRMALDPAPETGLTRLSDMPASYRAGFPRIGVDVHVYDPQPNKRFVLINGRRYREGDTLSEGPKLVEIRAQGLVMESQGQRVLLPLP